MNAQIKTLIDRRVPKYTKIKDKEFYFIVVAADNAKENLERAVEGFKGFTYCLESAIEKGVIYATGLWKKGDAEQSEFYNEAYDIGKSI